MNRPTSKRERPVPPSSKGAERSPYTLGQLLAECDEDAGRDTNDSLWLEAPSMGEELL